jgi:acetylornithine deacetylase
MDRREMLARIDRTRCVDFLAAMVRHKSYSGTSGESELARFMAANMRELGLSAELQEVESGRLNAIGRLAGTGGAKSLLFNGHLDTNPVTEGWTVDPWGGFCNDDSYGQNIGTAEEPVLHRAIELAGAQSWGDG